MTRAKRKEDAKEAVAAEDKMLQMGGNIQGLQEEIKNSKEKIDQWKKERKAINDQIKAEREKMEAKGITKRAFDAAMSYVDLTEDQQAGYDNAYIVAREALGKPIAGAQIDFLFEASQGEGESDGE